jgi:hypothetical protein
MSTAQTPATPSTPAKKESKVKSFFDHIGEWLEDHLGSASSFEHTASVALGVASPLLTTLLTLVAGEPIAAKVSAVVAQVQNDLSNTSAILNGAEASDATHSLTGFLGSVKTNLGTLLADADIKNSAKADQITEIVNTVIGEVEAVAAAIPENYTTPVVGASATSAA